MSERKSNEELGGGDSELSASNVSSLDNQDGVESATIPQEPVSLLDVTGPGLNPGSGRPFVGSVALCILLLCCFSFRANESVVYRRILPTVRPRRLTIEKRQKR